MSHFARLRILRRATRILRSERDRMLQRERGFNFVTRPTHGALAPTPGAQKPMPKPKEISKMHHASHSNRILLTSSASALLGALFLFACGSDEVGPADSDMSAGGTSTARTTNGSATTTPTNGTGGAKTTNEGPKASNQGGSRPADTDGRPSNGGGPSNQGGRTFGPAQGGFQFQFGGAAATTDGPTCRQGVQSGSVCNPQYDTTDCVRTSRTCQCDTATKQWACTPNASASGGSNSMGGQAATTHPSFAGTSGANTHLSFAGSTHKDGLAGAASMNVAGMHH